MSVRVRVMAINRDAVESGQDIGKVLRRRKLRVSPSSRLLGYDVRYGEGNFDPGVGRQVLELKNWPVLERRAWTHGQDVRLVSEKTHRMLSAETIREIP